MGYYECLEKAGCKIIDCREFGDYQGTWLAFVEYNGEKGIVEGSFGSCSGCDAFQAEFESGNEPTEKGGKYYRTYRTWDEDDECSKEEYDELVSQPDKRYVDFGMSYLSGGLYDKAHYERKLANLNKNDWFDSEQEEECKWAINQKWD